MSRRTLVGSVRRGDGRAASAQELGQGVAGAWALAAVQPGHDHLHECRAAVSRSWRRFDTLLELRDVAGHFGAGLAAYDERHEQLADAVAFEVDRDREP